LKELSPQHATLAFASTWFAPGQPPSSDATICVDARPAASSERRRFMM
jgi:hypothetical protein